MAKKILIIDDDADFIAYTKTVLETGDYSITSASNKGEALDKIGRDAPDLIIMDVMMEKMCDGFDLSRKLKSDDRYKGIPILMVTAVGDKTGFKFFPEIDETGWLPVDDFAEKPLSHDKLISKVKHLLSKPAKGRTD